MLKRLQNQMEQTEGGRTSRENKGANQKLQQEAAKMNKNSEDK